MKQRAWWPFINGRKEMEPSSRCEIKLTPGEIVGLTGGNVRLDCHQGRVWITQKGDGRDLILRGGEGVQTWGEGLLLIESLEPALVQITGKASLRP